MRKKDCIRRSLRMRSFCVYGEKVLDIRAFM